MPWLDQYDEPPANIKLASWYPQTAVRLIGTVAEWLEGQDLGSYDYTQFMRQMDSSGAASNLTFDYIKDSGAAVVGDPDRCVELAKRYEAAGCDLLLCLMNPYKIPHEQVMQSIELIGRHVIPEFK